MSSYSNDDVEMIDVDDDEDDEDQIESELDGESVPIEVTELTMSLATSTDESESESDGEEAPAPTKGDKNSQLIVGHKNDRTFVVRGDKIGVFKHSDEGKVEYAATLKDLGFKKMKSFKPKQVGRYSTGQSSVLTSHHRRCFTTKIPK